MWVIDPDLPAHDYDLRLRRYAWRHTQALPGVASADSSRTDAVWSGAREPPTVVDRGPSPLQRVDAELHGSAILTGRRLGDGKAVHELGEPFDLNVQLIGTGLDLVEPE